MACAGEAAISGPQVLNIGDISQYFKIFPYANRNNFMLNY